MDVIRAKVDARISQNLIPKGLAERTGIDQADMRSRKLCVCKFGESGSSRTVSRMAGTKVKLFLQLVRIIIEANPNDGGTAIQKRLEA